MGRAYGVLVPPRRSASTTACTCSSRDNRNGAGEQPAAGGHAGTSLRCRINPYLDQGGGASAAAPGSPGGGLWLWEPRPPQRPGQTDTDSQIQTAHRGGDREGGADVDVHPAGVNSFQYPSEMTSTLPPVTWMAVGSSMAYAGPFIPAAHRSASTMVLSGQSGLSRCGKMEKSTTPSMLSPPVGGFQSTKSSPMRGVSTMLPALSPT